MGFWRRQNRLELRVVSFMVIEDASLAVGKSLSNESPSFKKV